jgi:hypothetical protein
VYLIGNAPTSMTGIVDLTMSDDNPPIKPAPQVSSRMEAYELLFDKLTELRKGDKKHWYHRPVYRVSRQQLFEIVVNCYIAYLDCLDVSQDIQRCSQSQSWTPATFYVEATEQGTDEYLAFGVWTVIIEHSDPTLILTTLLLFEPIAPGNTLYLIGNM